MQVFVNREFVSHIAVVQHITQSGEGGNRHWFRYYRDGTFLPDMYLAGKCVTFTTHAIDRYGQRALPFPSNPAVMLVQEFFHQAIAVVQLNGNQPALAIDCSGTVAVLPFTETATEFLILTMLGPKEIQMLGPLERPRYVHMHYGRKYTPPRVRLFDMVKQITYFEECWRTKRLHEVLPAEKSFILGCSWTRLVQLSDRLFTAEGPSDGKEMRFLDDVYGPAVLLYKQMPGEEPAPALPVTSRSNTQP